MSKVRHVLGISGGKDSAALAVYLNKRHPDVDVQFYFCDTDKELEETYQIIKNVEIHTGKKILRLKAVENSPEDVFDHFLKTKGGYLPSSQVRWCTKKLKLDPFEKFVGEDPVISYVGIRGDEDREGYISKKSNIQSIFPFRKNIWSEDVIRQVLNNRQIKDIVKYYKKHAPPEKLNAILEYANQPLSPYFSQNKKLNALLEVDTVAFNKVVFEYLKTTDYPVGQLDSFPLVENEDLLVLEDILNLLKNSVGVPKYYDKVAYEVNGQKGHYARSRSGCFFCFFQQKIEWVWLYEQHPELFEKAMAYEKEGYSWNENETLEDIIQPDRLNQIKEEHLMKTQQAELKSSSPFLRHILADADGEGCAACFI